MILIVKLISLGDYMVIYGGQAKRTNSKPYKPCHGNDIYVYNLICHEWISLSNLYTSLQVTGESYQLLDILSCALFRLVNLKPPSKTYFWV